MSSLIEKNGHQSMLLRVNTEQWPSSQASFKKPKQLKDPVPDEMVPPLWRLVVSCMVVSIWSGHRPWP